MSVLNGSFEQADAIGTLTVSSTAVLWTLEFSNGVDSLDYALFDSDLYGAETFEGLWGAGVDSHERIDAFVGIGTDLVAAEFDTPAAPGAEDFENQWNSNEDRLDALGPIALAEFDAANDNFEDFEEEWGGNENRKSAFTGVGVDLTAALFDTANDAFEDFEEEWSGNEGRKSAFVGIGTDLVAAEFQKDAGTNAYEDFEEEITMAVPLTDITGGAAISLDPTQHQSVIIDLAGADVDMIVQWQRSGSTSYVPLPAAPWASTGTQDLEDNIVAVRIWMEDHRSGTPTATTRWRRLETL